MIITITLNGVKVKKEIPDSWEKVTYRQFLDLAKCENDLAKIIGMFTGIAPDIIRKSTIQNFYVIADTLGFLFNTKHEYHIPKRIATEKRSYDLPMDLEPESVGQFQDLSGICLSFKENDPTNLEKYPLIVATYAIPNYSFQAAETLAPEFFSSPCQEVLAIGNFTLAKLSALKINPDPISLPVATRQNKLRRVMRNFLSNLVSSAHLTSWKRLQEKAGMNY